MKVIRDDAAHDEHYRKYLLGFSEAAEKALLRQNELLRFQGASLRMRMSEEEKKI